MPGRMRDPSPRARDRLLAERRTHDERADPAPSTADADGLGGSGSAGRGRLSLPYERWTVDDLRKRAAELGVPGHSTLRKAELIEALRSR